MSLLNHSIRELEEKLHNNEITVEDLVQASYDQIESVDGEVNAFITLNKERALEKARELDKADDKSVALFGIPAGIKDNIMTDKLRTTCASQFLRNFNDPLYDATVVSKLDRKSTRLNSSHVSISYAVFCL